MKEAEEIIISKRFFELTPSELEAVKEFAANEEDYEAMKWFLQQTRSSFEEEKIEASPNLRAGVMAHLNQQPSGKTIWLNGVGAFLFPSQKKFYQYPGLQIAAVGLLLVGFVFLYDGTLSGADKTMAVNDTKNDDQIISENDIVGGEEGILNEVADASKPEETKEVDTRNQNAQNGPAPVVTEITATEREEESTIGNGSSNLFAMSVAEESRVVSDEKLLEQEPYGISNVVASDQKYYRADATNANVTTVDAENVESLDDVVLSGEMKKEADLGYKDKSNSAEDGNKNQKTIVAIDDVPEKNGTVATTTTVATNPGKADLDGGAFVTGSAGGVFGDTASEPETKKVLEVEIPAKDFSLSQTKELRSLFFVVK